MIMVSASDGLSGVAEVGLCGIGVCVICSSSCGLQVKQMYFSDLALPSPAWKIHSV